MESLVSIAQPPWTPGCIEQVIGRILRDGSASRPKIKILGKLTRTRIQYLSHRKKVALRKSVKSGDFFRAEVSKLCEKVLNSKRKSFPVEIVN